MLIFLIAAGCGLQANTDPDLTGEWDWVKTYGGFGGITMTPESEGYSQTLYFSKVNSWFIVREKEIIHSGNYRFTTVSVGGEKRSAILFDNRPMEIFYRLKSDTLFLDPNCMDCFHDIYVRKE